MFLRNRIKRNMVGEQRATLSLENARNKWYDFSFIGLEHKYAKFMKEKRQVTPRLLLFFVASITAQLLWLIVQPASKQTMFGAEIIWTHQVRSTNLRYFVRIGAKLTASIVWSRFLGRYFQNLQIQSGFQSGAEYGLSWSRLYNQP